MSTHEIGHEVNENAVRRFTRRAAPKTLLLAVALGLTLGLGASAPTDVGALPKRYNSGDGSCYYNGIKYLNGSFRWDWTSGRELRCQNGVWVTLVGAPALAES